MMTVALAEAMGNITHALANGQALSGALEPETRVCEAHGEYLATGTRHNLGKFSRDIWSTCPTCKEDAALEAEADRIKTDEAQHQARIQALLDHTAIPPRFIGRTFANYRAEQGTKAFNARDICYTYAKEFDRNLKTGASLVLSGNPGTGKSHLAAAILQEILPKHVGAYVTLMDLIRKLRDTWRRDSEMSESQLLAKLQAIPLLVIDEVGVQYGTDGERSILFDVMDRRYREVRPTILMTNLGKDDFRAAVGDRVFDRLTEVARWVPFDWPSYRTTARREMRDA